MKRRAAKVAHVPLSVAAELQALRGELIALGERVIAMQRTIDLAVTPSPEPVDDTTDMIGVVEAAELAKRSQQTLRRWADAGLPVGEYNGRLGRYVYSRRRLSAYLTTRRVREHGAT